MLKKLRIRYKLEQSADARRSSRRDPIAGPHAAVEPGGAGRPGGLQPANPLHQGNTPSRLRFRSIHPRRQALITFCSPLPLNMPPNVASGTNWVAHHDVWDDGNHITGFSPFQIAQAQKYGCTIDRWRPGQRCATCRRAGDNGLSGHPSAACCLRARRGKASTSRIMRSASARYPCE